MYHCKHYNRLFHRENTMKIGLRFWMVVCCVSCIALPLFAEEDETLQQDKIVRNTMFALGQRQIQAGEINEAMATL